VDAAVVLDTAAAKAVRSLIKRAAAVATERERVWLEAAPTQSGEDPLGEFFEKLELLGYSGSSDVDEDSEEPVQNPEDALSAVMEALTTLQAQLDADA